jgi:hypothetical protein
MLPWCLWLLAQVVDPRAEAGERLYSELEFEQAIVVLQDAIADDALAPSQRARALVFLGLSQAQIGKSANAQLSFTAAFRADPGVLVPSPQPSKIQALLDVARTNAAVPTTATAPPAVVPPVVAPPVAEPTQSPPWPMIVGIPGAVVLAGGVVVGVASVVRWRQAADPQTTQKDAVTWTGEANTLLVVGSVVAGAGAAALGVGVALALLE